MFTVGEKARRSREARHESSCAQRDAPSIFFAIASSRRFAAASIIAACAASGIIAACAAHDTVGGDEAQAAVDIVRDQQRRFMLI